MLRRLACDERGTTLIEFALLAMPLMILVCGTVEGGRLLFTWISLEGAVMEAARTSTASMELSEEQREEILNNTITERMSDFQTREDETLTIETRVYRDFGSSFPEVFTDVDGDGQYDVATENEPAEPFIDRNRNGQWDSDIPIDGTLGGPGDVVSYQATFPAPMLFQFLLDVTGMHPIDLTATAVVRNEPVARQVG